MQVVVGIKVEKSKLFPVLFRFHPLLESNKSLASLNTDQRLGLDVAYEHMVDSLCGVKSVEFYSSSSDKKVKKNISIAKDYDDVSDDIIILGEEMEPMEADKFMVDLKKTTSFVKKSIDTIVPNNEYKIQVFFLDNTEKEDEDSEKEDED